LRRRRAGDCGVGPGARGYHRAVTLRHRVFLLLEGDRPRSSAARWVQRALALLILLNVTAVVLETVPSIQESWAGFFAWFEAVSLAVFSAEYLLRLWSAVEHPAHRAPLGGRLRWIASPAALVDLVAVLPGLIPASAFDLRSIRLLRLLRIARVAKLGRYSVAVQTLHNVVRTRAADLLSLLVMLLTLLVVSSTLMYFLEHEAQPRAFSSIPATMWWGIVTLTTIGYGDLVPVTAAGRLLGGVIAIIGIGMFALPAGLRGAAFVEELGRARAAASRRHHAGASGGGACPHCGKELAPGPDQPSMDRST
jgi:voltage-gated potassium channel